MEKIWKKIKTWFKNSKTEEINDESSQGRFHWEALDMPRLLIIFLLGVFLLLLSFPSGKHSGNGDSLKNTLSEGGEEDTVQTDNAQDTAWIAMSRYAARQEEELEKVLASVDGVGDVDVMLTLAASEERKTLLQENVKQESTKESDSSGGERDQTVSSSETEPILVKEGEGQMPYVVRVESPQVEGVVVVAGGAGTGTVDAEIIAAVEALFPIEAHKIKVMKMKG